MAIVAVPAPRAMLTLPIAIRRTAVHTIRLRIPAARALQRISITGATLRAFRMRMPRFSANLSFLFNEVPFLERFGEAAHAGFRAVEFAFGYEYQVKEIAARVAEHKLEVVLINAPPGDYAAGDRGLASLPGREHEFAASVVTALRYAQELHCPRVHVMAGLLPEGADDEERARRLRMFKRNLRFACAGSGGQKVTILIEPLNPRDAPRYLLSTQADAHAIREEIALPNLRVQMDLYHAQIVEGDLTVKIRKWLPHIGHFQIAGVPPAASPISAN